MDKTTQDKIETLFELHWREAFGMEGGTLPNDEPQLENALDMLESPDIFEEMHAAFFAGYIAGLEARHVR